MAHEHYNNEIARLGASVIKSRAYRTVTEVYESNGKGGTPGLEGQAVGNTPNNPLTNGNCTWNGGEAACFPMLNNDAAYVDSIGIENRDHGYEDLGHTPIYLSATSVTVTGDVTAIYPTDARVEIWGVETGIEIGTVASSSYSSPDTTINLTSIILVNETGLTLRKARDSVPANVDLYSPVYDSAEDGARVPYVNDRGSSNVRLGGGPTYLANPDEVWFQFEMQVSSERFFEPSSPTSSDSYKIARIHRLKSGGFRDERFMDVRCLEFSPTIFELFGHLGYNGMDGYNETPSYVITKAGYADKWLRITVGYTEGMGYMRVWDLESETEISNIADTGVYTLKSSSVSYTSGGTYEVVKGDILTGATSGATMEVLYLEALDSGSWAGGDAVGSLWVKDVSGTFQAENLDVGASLNVCTIAGDVDAMETRTDIIDWDFAHHSTGHERSPGDPSAPPVWYRNLILSSEEIQNNNASGHSILPVAGATVLEGAQISVSSPSLRNIVPGEGATVLEGAQVSVYTPSLHDIVIGAGATALTGAFPSVINSPPSDPRVRGVRS